MGWVKELEAPAYFPDSASMNKYGDKLRSFLPPGGESLMIQATKGEVAKQDLFLAVWSEKARAIPMRDRQWISHVTAKLAQHL